MASSKEDLIRRGNKRLRQMQDCTDDAERVRLKTEFYDIADRIFPEAKALRDTYRRARGETRAALKETYMNRVHALWESEVNNRAPGPAPKASPNPEAVPQPKRKNTAFYAITAIVVIGVAAGIGVLLMMNSNAMRQEQVSIAEPVEESIAPVTIDQSPEPAPTRAAPMREPESQPAEEPEAIVVEVDLTPLPDELKGLGDTIEADGDRYTDVYIRESSTSYYVQIPEKGTVVRVDVDDVDPETGLTFGEEPARQAILEIWEANRDAVAAADAERDRLAQAAELERERQARFAERDRQRRKAIEAEMAVWRERETEWIALTPAAREGVRAKTYGNWRAVHEDIAKAEELYERITLLYELLGIQQARRVEVTDAYRQIRSSYGPRYDIENKLIQAAIEEEQGIRVAQEWEAEYRELVTFIEREYPVLEQKVAEIIRLDSALPPETLGREHSYDWDTPWAPGLDSDDEDSDAKGFGTGFVVAKGFVLTCDHVLKNVNNCDVITTAGKTYAGVVVQRDRRNDWGLVRVDGLDASPIPMNDGKPIVGGVIHCVGYPLAGLRDSVDPVAGSGNIAALQRYDGDQRFLQITAPVNPGNSGGPLLNEQGEWIGVISQKMNDAVTLEAADIVAQGFNFATKASFVSGTLDERQGVTLTKASGRNSQALNLAEIVEKVKPSIVKIAVR